MAEFHFGGGDFFAIPIGVANPTPVQFSALQSFELDFKFETKTLHGRGQFPIAVVRGKGSIGGKLKNALVNGAMVSSLFFGATPAAGQLMTVVGEAAAVPGAGPYTVQPANNTTFQDSLGIIDASTGMPLTRVAAAPAAGQYSLVVVSNVATYTFAAADTGKAILLSYSYTTATGGNQSVISSQTMGSTVQFKGLFTTSAMVQGVTKRATIQLNVCSSSDLKLSGKQDDFMVPEMSISAYADVAGNVGIVSFAD